MLKGRIDVVEMQAWSDDLISGLKRLKPGFSVISEILECQPTTEEGRQILVETQRKAKELGMGNVVRIVKMMNAVTANQWQRSSRSVGYSALEAESVEDADKILDELDRKKN
ncbi:MAG: hypothetical protein M1480_08215 [Bacteroidetes bacterium]|nr:hypothetical protein [Bacteroidota bacterium]